jgi:hypothetical protein
MALNPFWKGWPRGASGGLAYSNSKRKEDQNSEK